MEEVTQLRDVCCRGAGGCQRVHQSANVRANMHLFFDAPPVPLRRLVRLGVAFFVELGVFGCRLKPTVSVKVVVA